MAAARATSAIAIAATSLLFASCSDDASTTDADSRFGSGDAPASASEPRVSRYDVGGRPDAVSAGAGYAWVLDTSLGSLDRLNPRSKRPIPVEVAGFPTDVSAGEGAAWLALGDGGAIQRVTGTEGPAAPIDLDSFGFGVAAGEGAVWSLTPNMVQRVDPSSGQVLPTGPVGEELVDIAAGEGAVWIVNSDGIARLAPDNGEGLGQTDVPGAFSVTTGESAAWVLGKDVEGSTVTRIDGDGAVAGEPVRVPGARAIAAGLGYVWVLAENGLVRLDPETGVRVGSPVRVGAKPAAVAVGEGSAWVAAREGAVYHVTP